MLINIPGSRRTSTKPKLRGTVSLITCKKHLLSVTSLSRNFSEQALHNLRILYAEDLYARRL
jgi:hypothetical protein